MSDFTRQVEAYRLAGVPHRVTSHGDETQIHVSTDRTDRQRLIHVYDGNGAASHVTLMYSEPIVRITKVEAAPGNGYEQLQASAAHVTNELHVGGACWASWGRRSPYVAARNLTYHVLDPNKDLVLDEVAIRDYLTEHGFGPNYRAVLMIDLESDYRQNDAGIECMVQAAEICRDACPLARIGFYNPIELTTSTGQVRFQDDRLDQCEACDVVMPSCYDWWRNSGEPGDSSYATHQEAYNDHVGRLITAVTEASPQLQLIPAICATYTGTGEEHGEPMPLHEFTDNLEACAAVFGPVRGERMASVYWWGTTLTDEQVMAYAAEITRVLNGPD